MTGEVDKQGDGGQTAVDEGGAGHLPGGCYHVEAPSGGDGRGGARAGAGEDRAHRARLHVSLHREGQREGQFRRSRRDFFVSLVNQMHKRKEKEKEKQPYF